MKQDLWVEKYRPLKIDEYVWQDANQKNMIEEIIKTKKLPNLLLSGSPGVGKTTLAKIILRNLDISDSDILEINGSIENGIDVIREKIANFVSRIGLNNIRCVLFDEADYLSQYSQASLRNMIETFSSNARFIFTCNYQHKIIPALKSRCQHYDIKELDKDSFRLRAAEILISEGIDFDLEILDSFIKKSYPDLRKCINLLQQHSVNGKLIYPNDYNDETSNNFYEEIIEKIKNNKINEARRIITEHLSIEEFEDFYKFLYKNLNLFCDNEEEEKYAVLIIKEGLVDHAICADPEINLTATIIKLSFLLEKKNNKGELKNV